MSFWESIKNKETVVLSDDAIDLLSDTLLEIKKIYQEDLERMPTVAELEALILRFITKFCDLVTKKRKR
ncbi:hypothetical protein HNQ82_002339 [Anoxybacillus tengchongensis]|uniref:Uncharacterized protein n=2 Tax=Anoxybacillus tengchongensis TaxID=576944 RepID=A0A7W9YSH0_9BACL|nr:hypothetical protein [Anoxybacillus tengchongensis]